MNKKITQLEMPDVSGIDYGNLTGDNWKNYQAIEAKLKMHQHYDFEQVGAKLEKEFGLDKKTGKPTQTAVGLVVTTAKPYMRTRISWRDAKTLNIQVDNNGRYMLLAKEARKFEEEA